MKYDFSNTCQYWLLSAFAMLAAWNLAMAQQVPKSYFFDEDEVVFEFDRRAYLEAVNGQTGETVDFADLDIEEVVVTGDFRNWSKDGWRMEKIGRNRFQLRKKIEDFTDEFTWDFKFLVNGRYWVGPEKPSFNPKMHANDFLEDVYQLNLYEASPSPVGNALFTLSGYEAAREVVLSGSFNGWNERRLKMNRVEGGWQLRLELPPGRYEYKFIADGLWLHDPANPKKIRNQHGTFNSILDIRKEVTFRLAGFSDARRVILAGSFNDWNERKTRMERKDGAWQISLDLAGGKHYYKFIVDGEWMTDPANPLKEKDWRGNVNSVLFVQ